MPTDYSPQAAAALVQECRIFSAAAPDGPWCEVIPPNDVDPDRYVYGYGQLRTAPTDDDSGGWNLLLEVPKHDEQDATLLFCAKARTGWPEAVDMLEAAEQQLRERDATIVGLRETVRRWEHAALLSLAGLVPTPEKGYGEKLGHDGIGQFLSDSKRLRERIRQYESRTQEQANA